MFGLIAKLFYAPFKAGIMAAWNAAKADAFTEIRAQIQAETEPSVDEALAEVRPEAIEDKRKKK